MARRRVVVLGAALAILVGAAACDAGDGGDEPAVDVGGSNGGDDAGATPDAVAAADTGAGTGESCLGSIAWYQENAEGRAVEPGGKAANAWGLHDVLGNAVEWVADCWHETYDGAPTDGSAWDEDDCAYRVVRGGCYGTTPRGLRVSVREGVTPAFYGACAPGVRCVRDVGAAADPLGLTWVSIPAGRFSMGCSADDDQCYDSELPAHTVTVAAFEMLAREVTQEDYHDQTGLAPSSYYCPACAVTYVMWEEARDFCAALGGRLPTEAEWEYAARAGTTTPYFCGAE